MNWIVLRGKGIGDTSYMKNGDCWAMYWFSLADSLSFEFWNDLKQGLC